MSRKDLSEVKSYGRIYRYPCGVIDLMASSVPIFCEAGWERAGSFAQTKPVNPGQNRAEKRDRPETAAEDLSRSMRRARARVRRLSLANDFRWFVTLTLDPAKVDRLDSGAVIKKLNAWCSNAVQRYGLQYILVPERHKDGAIHFHGFFNDALEAVDSGTMRLPWAKKPRRPRSEAERAEWGKLGGKAVYNLPGWSLGFTTAMELYGEYPAAVAYVCKYIGKDGDKPAGRWYYSGGELREPQAEYLDISPAELREEFGDRAFLLYPPGKQIAVVNGVKVPEQVLMEEV